MLPPISARQSVADELVPLRIESPTGIKSAPSAIKADEERTHSLLKDVFERMASSVKEALALSTAAPSNLRLQQHAGGSTYRPERIN